MTDTQVMAALEPTQILIDALNKIAICKSRAPGDVVDIAQKAIAAWNRIASSPAATLPDCIVNGDVEAWLFSHPDRDGDMEAGRLELFNFRMGYAAPVPPPAGDDRVEQAGEWGESCERCQGNGEIITDWDRYLHGQPEDKGDEGTADCPDCNGTGRVDAQPAAPAGDAELREIVRPFAEVASAILAEAPADADSFALFTDCQRNTYAVSMDELRALSALATPPSVPAQQGEGWQGIATAPRDGSYILAIVAPNRGRHLEHQAGRVFVIRHEGKTVSDYDPGWAVYPGFGGASDYDFTYWMPLPATPPSQDQKGVDHG